MVSCDRSGTRQWHLRTPESDFLFRYYSDPLFGRTAKCHISSGGIATWHGSVDPALAFDVAWTGTPQVSGDRIPRGGILEIVDHTNQPREEWRAGVTTRMRFSALTGGKQLTIFEQWCDPGLGAPEHFHPCEEVLSVIDGKAEIWAEGSDSVVVSAGQSVFVPAGQRHKYRNCGQDRLHMQFTLASPIFEASYDDGTVSRRWIADLRGE